MEKNKQIKSFFLVLAMLLVAISMVSAAVTVTSSTPADNNLDTDGAVDFVTVFDTAENSTAFTCTLDFSGTNPGATSHTGTVTNSTAIEYTCTVSLTNMPEQTYYWTMTGTNSSDTVTSTQRTLTIDESSGTRNINAEQQQESITLAAGDTDGMSTGTWVAIIAVVLVAIILITRKK